MKNVSRFCVFVLLLTAANSVFANVHPISAAPQQNRASIAPAPSCDPSDPDCVPVKLAIAPAPSCDPSDPDCVPVKLAIAPAPMCDPSDPDCVPVR